MGGLTLNKAQINWIAAHPDVFQDALQDNNMAWGHAISLKFGPDNPHIEWKGPPQGADVYGAAPAAPAAQDLSWNVAGFPQGSRTSAGYGGYQYGYGYETPESQTQAGYSYPSGAFSGDTGMQAGYQYPSGAFSGDAGVQAGYNYPSGAFSGDQGIQAGYQYIPGLFSGEANPYGFASPEQSTFADMPPLPQMWSDVQEAGQQATDNTLINTILSRGLNWSYPQIVQAGADFLSPYLAATGLEGAGAFGGPPGEPNIGTGFGGGSPTQQASPTAPYDVGAGYGGGRQEAPPAAPYGVGAGYGGGYTPAAPQQIEPTFAAGDLASSAGMVQGYGSYDPNTLGPYQARTDLVTDPTAGLGYGEYDKNELGPRNIPETVWNITGEPQPAQTALDNLGRMISGAGEAIGDWFKGPPTWDVSGEPKIYPQGSDIGHQQSFELGESGLPEPGDIGRISAESGLDQLYSPDQHPDFGGLPPEPYEPGTGYGTYIPDSSVLFGQPTRSAAPVDQGVAAPMPADVWASAYGNQAQAYARGGGPQGGAPVSAYTPPMGEGQIAGSSFTASNGMPLASSDSIDQALTEGPVKYYPTDGSGARLIYLNDDGTLTQAKEGLTQPTTRGIAPTQLAGNLGARQANGTYANSALVRDYGYDGDVGPQGDGYLARNNPLSGGATYTTPASTFGGAGDPNRGAISNHIITDTEYTISFPFEGAVGRAINANGGVTVTGANGVTIEHIYVADIGPNMNPQNRGGTTANSLNRGADLAPALYRALGVQTDGTVQIRYPGDGTALTYSSTPTAAQQQAVPR